MRLIFVDHPPAHEPEIAGILRDLNLSNPINHLVPDFGNYFFDPGLSFPSPALRIHDIVTLLPFFNHLDDQFRRILQIDVDYHDSFSRGVLQTRQCCKGLPKSPRKLEQLDAILIFSRRQDLFFRSWRSN